MTKTIVQIGPSDNGKPMSLAEFEQAKFKKGYLYELNRGVLAVLDVPDEKHGLQVDALNRQLSAYGAKHPDELHSVVRGNECRILLPRINTERHPDLAVYKLPAAANPKKKWIPDIVIEVASPSSHRRDYVEKREEYLQAGVREYWIVDAAAGYMVALPRFRGRWAQQLIRPPETYKTRLLPGFELNLRAVFRGARPVK